MAHLDYKPDNLVFDEDFLLKMIDFGSSDKLSSILTRWVTTPNYAPPEVLYGNRFNKNSGPEFKAIKVDIFSLGTVLFMIQYLHPPFEISAEKLNPM